jgi:hypothetical protein
MTEQSKTAEAFEVKRVSISSIVPYWRNPRENTLAVEKVKESIEKFGYQQPILLDKKMVIIAGHSRYRALMMLGYTEVDVIVSEMPVKKAKEYRIIDNKTSEYATWTNELILELKEFEDFRLVESFFPDVKLDLGFAEGNGISPITQDMVDSMSENFDNRFSEDKDSRSKGQAEITCPHCFEAIILNKADFEHGAIWKDSDELL